jgi:predicted Fe-Mo cluster-binding NifX family protein
MKIVITAQGETPDSAIDQRFGRALWFLVYDEETDNWKAIDNSQAYNAMQGAGIQAAQTVLDQKTQIVISGATGPKAFRALEAGGVKMFIGASGTVKEALEAFKKGQLKEATMADATGFF